jgi:hypothetical protein
MPITYQIDPKLWLVEMRCAGPVSMADLQAKMQTVFDDPLFGANMNLLGDIAGIVPQFTTKEVTAYQEWRKQMPRFGKLAIVASTDFEFGVGRQFELGTNAIGGSDVRVFRSMKQARDWLGLPDSQPKSTD